MSNNIGMFCSGKSGLLYSGMVANISPEYSKKRANRGYFTRTRQKIRRAQTEEFNDALQNSALIILVDL
ncbi:MAG: hypothetical protein WCI92_12485 [Bacteroidota bacterium]